MVLNLIKAGHRLTVYNRSEPARERARQAGATVVESPRAVAEAGEIVGSCIATPTAVESVYLGPDGLIEGARANQLFIDLSSNTPGLAKKLAARLAGVGASFVDAPVSGGSGGAKAGTLTIMAGGEEESLRRATPVFDAIGDKVFHVGPVGAGSTIKILNQLLVGINVMAVVEMVALARRSGIDLNLVQEIIGASTGSSKVFHTRFPKAVNHDFSLGFAIDLMAKDLRLGRDMAEELKGTLPLTSQALSLYEQASKAGYGQLDTSAAVQLFESVEIATDDSSSG